MWRYMYMYVYIRPRIDIIYLRVRVLVRVRMRVCLYIYMYRHMFFIVDLRFVCMIYMSSICVFCVVCRRSHLQQRSRKPTQILTCTPKDASWIRRWEATSTLGIGPMAHPDQPVGSYEPNGPPLPSTPIFQTRIYNKYFHNYNWMGLPSSKGPSGFRTRFQAQASTKRLSFISAPWFAMCALARVVSFQGMSPDFWESA